LLLVDAGTSYIKIFNTKINKVKIIPVSEIKNCKITKADYATGHNANFFYTSKNVNELIALAKGSEKIINKPNFTVLDIGSRDMKTVQYKKKEFDKCDWNTSCGAMIGFTIDLITKYFKMDPNKLKTNDKAFDITCGLLGITKFFDSISKENTIEEGISSLIHGMAKFSWIFAGKPKELYLSGGLCDNKLFVEYMKKYIKKINPIGRYVLIEGLKNLANHQHENYSAK
jgi:activator of 2-hydroxyglutaryl-CoA dehydratase